MLVAILASRRDDALEVPEVAQEPHRSEDIEDALGPGEELAGRDAREVPSPLPGPASATVPAAEPIDEQRLEATRAEVARLLLEAASEITDDSSPERLEAFAQLFDLNSLSLRREDWPVRRMVERLLEAPDATVARAAARYLGLRGDVVSRSRLELALARPEVARAATLAFRDAGADGIEGLGRALALPSERELALEALRGTSGPETAQVLAAAITDMGDDEQRTPLLETLTEHGADALAPLFTLGLEGALTLDELLAQLDRIEGADEWLLEGLDARERDAPRELRLRCVAVLAPGPAARWLEGQVHARDRALQNLARELVPHVPGPAAVASLVRLSDDTRLSSEDMRAMSLRALELDEGRFAHVAGEYVQAGDVARTTALAELLIAAESALVLPAVRVVAQSPELPETLACDLVTLIGEGGEAGDVESLLALFARLGAGDRQFAACCIVALHRLGGEAAVERALVDGRERSLMNILGLLRRRTAGSGTTPSLYKLARELKPYLSDRAQHAWRIAS